MARTPIVAGNWKMNMRRNDGEALAASVSAGADGLGCAVVLCPPAVLIPVVAGAIGERRIGVGGQDCHAEASGAHTGDISAGMLADSRCGWVIVGHSERRTDHGETDAAVQAKAAAALGAGLIAIVCVGETEAERDAGDAEAVVERQVRASLPEGATAETVVIAYEPVWAIGTGRTPTTDDIAAMHTHIRAVLSDCLGGDEAAGTRILYGGSVKPGNAVEIMALEGVDGALVGGASLKADDFLAICRAASGA